MGAIKISTEYKVGWGMWEWGACVLCGSIRRCTRGKCKSWSEWFLMWGKCREVIYISSRGWEKGVLVVWKMLDRGLC